MSEDLRSQIGAHPLAAGLAEEAVDTLAGCATETVFETASLLISEGESADTLYLLQAGRVSVEVHGPGRGRVVLETLGPGDVVGWSSLSPPYRWQFDVRALEPVVTLAIDAVCVRARAEEDPAFGYELMRRVGSSVLRQLQATRVRLLDLYGDHGPN